MDSPFCVRWPCPPQISPLLTIMARRPAADWSELLRLEELMRDEPDKRCHRLYFNEENPLDIALRRWIWSLPSRNRCHTHQKHLEEAAHRLGQNEEPLREAVGPTGPASGLTLYSCRTGTRETNRHHRPDSIHDRPSLRPEDLRIIVAMHVDKLVRTGLRIPRILNNPRKPNSATTFLQAYKP
jgi:hypothetical protein